MPPPPVPEITTPSAALSSSTAVIVPLFADDGSAALEVLPEGVRIDIQQARGRGEFRAKPCDLYFTSGGDPRVRFIGVGLGPRAEASSERWRRAAAAGALTARARGLDRIAVLLSEAAPLTVQAVAEGVTMAAFDVDAYRTTDRETVSLAAVRIGVPGGEAAATEAARRGFVLGRATNTARSLANEPGNVLPPRELASRATTLAAEAGLRAEVLTGGALEALGMRLLLGVGRGSAEPPHLIVLRYEPEDSRGLPTLGLVGKGITFDTGGISIKPSASMDRMKYDMAGAAAVLAAMQAVAELGAPVRVVGVVPAAENMPGGRAIRPGDVIRSASGKTVEIADTDAEGRLVLADALWYAREHAGATHLVDVATLTGAIVIALGRFASGLFSADARWASLIREVSEDAGDRVWPLPVHDDYAEQLKSDIADLVNIGGRPAGSVTAAVFLKAFAGAVPWAHLDIAGTAWLEEGSAWMPKGPTGVMTRTLASLALAGDRFPR
jgi:leucyl aminopeptidase